MPSKNDAIIVKGLSKSYALYKKPTDRLKQLIVGGNKIFYDEFYALRNVSFNVLKGEVFGVIGKNGSGKSTLLQILTGTLNQSSGKIYTHGRIASILELGSGFNMDFTGRENVYLIASLMGFNKSEINEKLNAIIDFAEIEKFIDLPVKTYSSGMLVRLAFATQINIDPEIFIIDEALAVGDTFFSLKCMKKLQELKRQGLTIVLVSHDITAIRLLCDRVVWLDKGKLLKIGDPSLVADAYLANDIEFYGAESDCPHKIDRNTEKNKYKNKENVEVKSIEFVKSKGKRLAVKAGDLIHIKFYLKNKYIKLNKQLLVGYILKNTKGVDIASSNSKYEGVKINLPPAGKSCVIEIKFTLPFLHHGVYSFNLNIANIDSQGKVKALKILKNCLIIDLLESKKCDVLMTLPTNYFVKYSN
jgi:lipopolysaccharide transport system ATP-binding protein